MPFPIADRPIQDLSKEIDSLNFKPLVGSLSKSIVHGETPLSMGIYGSWGCGKTSILRMLREKIKPSDRKSQKIETVWFNAWEHQGAENLVEPLMSAILRQSPGFKRLISEVNKLTKVMIRTSAEVALRTLTKKAISGNEISRIRDHYSDVKDHIDETARLRREFKQIVTRALGKSGKLVVFIDDLDRCMPDTTLALMEAMKLFFWVEGCVYVAGVDRRVITASVEAYFRNKGLDEFPFDPTEYLAKIFEVSINIPLNENRIKDYIRHLLSLDEHLNRSAELDKGLVEFILSLIADNNPREAKRLVNSTYLMMTMWNNLDIKDKDSRFRPYLAAISMAVLRNPTAIASVGFSMDQQKILEEEIEQDMLDWYQQVAHIFTYNKSINK